MPLDNNAHKPAASTEPDGASATAVAAKRKRGRPPLPKLEAPSAQEVAERCLATIPTLRSLADAAAARVRELHADDVSSDSPQGPPAPKPQARDLLLQGARRIREGAITGIFLQALDAEQARQLDAIVASLRERAMQIGQR